MPDGGEARRRHRTRPRSKKPSKRLSKLLYNLGWIGITAVLGLPLLALLLFVL